MTKNSEEAARLVAKLNKVPTLMVSAVSREVYRAVLNNTVQDSGEAAFNWRADINTSRVRPYVHMRGRDPVGSTGDKRSASFDRSLVIDDRLSNFITRLGGKDVKTVHIYNPIEDDDHAFNARLDQARAVAANPGWMQEIAERALRHAKL